MLLRLLRVDERGSTSPLSMRWMVRALTSQYSASFSCVRPFCCRSSAILSSKTGLVHTLLLLLCPIIEKRIKITMSQAVEKLTLC